MTSLGPLFDLPVQQPTGVRTVVPASLADVLAGYADLALSDRSEPLLAMATRAAGAILDAQGSVCIWEVRVALGRLGLLENAGKEDLDALGTVGRRLGLRAEGRERPPVWVAKLLPASHLNVGTRWVRPATLSQRQAAIERSHG